MTSCVTRVLLVVEGLVKLPNEVQRLLKPGGRDLLNDFKEVMAVSVAT